MSLDLHFQYKVKQDIFIEPLGRLKWRHSCFDAILQKQGCKTSYLSGGTGRTVYVYNSEKQTHVYNSEKQTGLFLSKGSEPFKTRVQILAWPTYFTKSESHADRE